MAFSLNFRRDDRRYGSVGIEVSKERGTPAVVTREGG
jgi:hypothetical protein